MDLLVIPPTIIFFGEIGSYIWHSLFAHSSFFKNNPVKTTHDIHHRIIEDKADKDFLWVLLLLFLFLLFLSFLYLKNIITLRILLLVYVPLFILFSWNWYIHRCYHIENHWLNKYSWFIKDKEIHMKHHTNEDKNYGISTHFCDYIFDTFQYPYPLYSLSTE